LQQSDAAPPCSVASQSVRAAWCLTGGAGGQCARRRDPAQKQKKKSRPTEFADSSEPGLDHAPAYQAENEGETPAEVGSGLEREEGVQGSDTNQRQRRSMFADLLPDLYSEQQDLPRPQATSSAATGGARSRTGDDRSAELDEESLMRTWAKVFTPMGMTLESKLGKGSLAMVYLAKGQKKAGNSRAKSKVWRCPEAQEVAVKVLLPKPASKSVVRREFVVEQKVWAQMDHPGIAKVLHVQRPPAVPLDEMMIVMEACKEGNLLDYLRRREEGQEDAFVAMDIPALAMDLATALSYMHKQGLAHRDVKSPNVLLSFDDRESRLKAKLCDFSSAALLTKSIPHRGPEPVVKEEEAKTPTKVESPGDLLGWGSDLLLHAVRNLGTTNDANSYQPVGTLAWMAPEMLVPPYEGDPVLDNPEAYGKADVYAFGCILYELITRRVPWPSEKKFGREEVVQAVVYDGWRPWLPSYVHPQLASVIKDCWERDPVKRPTMTQVVDRLNFLTRWSTDGSIEDAAATARARYDQKVAFRMSVEKLGGNLRVELIGTGKTILVGPRGCIVGRMESCTLQLKDRSVSRLHARIIPTVNGFMLIDNQSSNGTTLNWKQVGVEGMLLEDGDTLKCGREVIRVFREPVKDK